MNRFILRALVLFISVVGMFVFNVDSASAASDCATYIDRGYCVPGYISNETWWTAAPQHSYGKAVWYAPYLMEATAKWRGQDLEGFAGGVAMMSPADIGEVVWLQRPDYEWEGPFLVVDVSSTIHMWTTITINEEVVEVDFNTAVRWGMVDGDEYGYTINEYMIRDVEVYKGLHPPFESSEPIDYVKWFKEEVLAWGNGTYDRWSFDSINIHNYEEYQNLLASYLQIDLLIIYNKTNEKPEDVFESVGGIEEESSNSIAILDSTISIKDAHHYTQEYLETVRVVDKIAWEVDCNDDNPYNGFVFVDYCVPGVISKESWLSDYPKHTIGVATFYAAGLMDTVLENRGMSLKGYVDGIVTMTCGNVGDSAWIKRPGLGWEGPYLVVDCGGPHGVWAFTQYQLHVEVDYDRWLLWESTTGHQNIEICMGSNSCDDSFPTTWWNYWLLFQQGWVIPVESIESEIVIAPDL